ncbi:Panacea domain-containing protein [Roseibium sp.]|uniref:Panacea domain-containing protein n=1 Tax=Roseibium sp. TaxID=1936156 RepID=UPI003BAAF80A
MAHDARAIANFFLDCAIERQLELTSLSLLKLLYFAHAWHLAKYNSPLAGQPFEAWKHGPVNRVVYDQTKRFGRNPIKTHLKRFDPKSCEYVDAKTNLTDEEVIFLTDIFRFYSKFSATELSELSHETDGPWDKVWKAAQKEAVPGMFIPDDMIKSWIQKNRGEEVQ